MTARKICENCKYYTPSTLLAEPTLGKCDLAGGTPDYKDEYMPADRIAGWDYEGYSAGVYVGPRFGCIHWRKKP